MLPSEEAKANGSQAGADWIAAEKAADGAAPIEKGARARLRVLATWRACQAYSSVAPGGVGCESIVSERGR